MGVAEVQVREKKSCGMTLQDDPAANALQPTYLVPTNMIRPCCLNLIQSQCTNKYIIIIPADVGKD